MRNGAVFFRVLCAPCISSLVADSFAFEEGGGTTALRRGVCWETRGALLWSCDGLIHCRTGSVQGQVGGELLLELFLQAFLAVTTSCFLHPVSHSETWKVSGGYKLDIQNPSPMRAHKAFRSLVHTEKQVCLYVSACVSSHFIRASANFCCANRWAAFLLAC